MKPFREALRIVSLLGSILLVGVAGYHFIEGWSLFDALYMTVITLATVGYGETHPLSTTGRVFTMFLILGGMGMILYGVSRITSFVVEGEMSGILRRRRMNRTISHMSNHYIVCGWGNTGYYAVEELHRTRRPYVVVENDPSRIEQLVAGEMMYIEGDATSDATLIAAGIQRAAGLISSLPTDRDNMFVVITARGLNPTFKIVSKIEDISSRDKFLRGGANIVISSDFIGGLRMVSELVRPGATSFLDSMLRDNSALRVEDVKVGLHSKYVKKPVGSCDVFAKSGVLLVSMKRADEFHFNPPPATILESGDTLVVIGNPEQLQSVRGVLSGS
ncbi:MAG: potassium channel protein [Ignavibacteriales bacterium]|nr:potassium channel protein [Ignavibacteriales bacterium]